jgi:NAD(P)-dependent dehydrogenase (short-subunit alcohol dehydrogenase family)
MNDRFDLRGKVVLLTGAAGGIGRALAQGFWEAGSIVLPVVRQAKVDWGTTLPGQATSTWRPLVCDLAQPNAARELVDLALAAGGGRVDVLINNAGITLAAGNDQFAEQLRREVHRINFEIPYALCGLFAPLMAEQGGGAIINVTSINAELAFPANPAYVTSKAALRLLTKSVARDFGARGVRANNLCPGYIKTRMTATSQADPALNEERRSRTMLGRWGKPEDLVGPALFLASDAARYITGLDLYVDGGWSAMGL